MRECMWIVNANETDFEFHRRILAQKVLVDVEVSIISILVIGKVLL